MFHTPLAFRNSLKSTNVFINNYQISCTKGKRESFDKKDGVYR